MFRRRGDRGCFLVCRGDGIHNRIKELRLPHGLGEPRREARARAGARLPALADGGEQHDAHARDRIVRYLPQIQLV